MGLDVATWNDNILRIDDRLAPGSAADVRAGPTRVGCVGTVHITFSLRIRIAVMELPAGQAPLWIL